MHFENLNIWTPAKIYSSANLASSFKLSDMMTEKLSGPLCIMVMVDYITDIQLREEGRTDNTRLIKGVIAESGDESSFAHIGWTRSNQGDCRAMIRPRHLTPSVY